LEIGIAGILCVAGFKSRSLSIIKKVASMLILW
jgi:hypothetical protein